MDLDRGRCVHKAAEATGLKGGCVPVPMALWSSVRHSEKVPVDGEKRVNHISIAKQSPAMSEPNGFLPTRERLTQPIGIIFCLNPVADSDASFKMPRSKGLQKKVYNPGLGAPEVNIAET